MAKQPALAWVALLIAAAVSFSCYAKHFPKGEAELPASSSRVEPVAIVAGVTEAETAAGDNVRRIHPTDVVARFAKRLDEETLFSAVVFPHTELSTVSPDVILEVSVRSDHDFHSLRNSLKELAVGLSFLLLQPVLPTEYDFEVELALDATTADGQPIEQYRQRSDYRFQSTWLQASEESIDQWHRDTVSHAVDALIAQLKHDRSVFRDAVSTPLGERD